MRAIACALVASACISEPGAPSTDGVARVWRQRTDLDPLPGALYAPHLFYDSKRQRVLMYGGNDEFSNASDALWQLETAGWSEICQQCTNGGINDSAVAYDAASDRIVIFGGTPDFSSFENDVYVLDGDSTTFQPLTTTNAPSGRAGAQLVFDPDLNELFMFGGYVANAKSSDDVYTLVGTTWTQITPPSPNGQGSGGIADGTPIVAYDHEHARFVALADPDGQLRSQTWLYDPADAAWPGAPACVTCFAERTAAAIVHIPDYDQTFVIGGFGDGPTSPIGLTDTEVVNAVEAPFEFDSVATMPVRRGAFGAVYDPTRDVVVTYGGSPDVVTPTTSDTWELVRATP